MQFEGRKYLTNCKNVDEMSILPRKPVGQLIGPEFSVEPLLLDQNQED
jgi:hypothetical protein